MGRSDHFERGPWGTNRTTGTLRSLPDVTQGSTEGRGWGTPRSQHGGVDEVPLPGVTGRLWLAGKHFVGPDPDAALAEVGADVLVCLNEAPELADRYPHYVHWLGTNAGGRAVWQPVPDLHAPPLEEAVALLDDLAAMVRDGRGVLVHCGAGIGRAGTIAAGLLMVLGTPMADALATVAGHRPMAGPEAGVQSELLEALAGLRP